MVYSLFNMSWLNICQVKYAPIRRQMQKQNGNNDESKQKIMYNQYIIMFHFTGIQEACEIGGEKKYIRKPGSN